MFSLKERFEFLKDGVDFPFYNGKPERSLAEILIMPVAVILMVSLMFIPVMTAQYFPILFFLISAVAVFLLCKGDYGLFFKMPKLRDLLTIILCFLGYYIYVMAMTVILSRLGYAMSANVVLTSYKAPSMFLVVSDILQLFGEEFLKIFILLFVMYVVYRLTRKRGPALYVGIIATLFIFGIIHSGAYSGKIVQILLIQGLGSIFALYPYLKTKNMINSYILHLLVDFVPFTMVFIATTMGITIPGV